MPLITKCQYFFWPHFNFFGNKVTGTRGAGNPIATHSNFRANKKKLKIFHCKSLRPYEPREAARWTPSPRWPRRVLARKHDGHRLESFARGRPVGDLHQSVWNLVDLRRTPNYISFENFIFLPRLKKESYVKLFFNLHSCLTELCSCPH